MPGLCLCQIPPNIPQCFFLCLFLSSGDASTLLLLLPIQSLSATPDRCKKPTGSTFTGEQAKKLCLVQTLLCSGTAGVEGDGTHYIKHKQSEILKQVFVRLIDSLLWDLLISSKQYRDHTFKLLRISVSLTTMHFYSVWFYQLIFNHSTPVHNRSISASNIFLLPL